LHALIQLQDVLRELTDTPVQPCQPDPTGAVTGTVYGPGPLGPLPGATLAVIDTAGHVIASTTTNHEGRYDLPELPAGHWTLVVADYPSPASGRIKLAGGNDGTLDLVLDPADGGDRSTRSGQSTRSDRSTRSGQSTTSRS
jgi:hypothetical protein